MKPELTSPLPLYEYYFNDASVQDVEALEFESQQPPTKELVQQRIALLETWVALINDQMKSRLPHPIYKAVLTIYAKDWASEKARDQLCELVAEYNISGYTERYCNYVFNELLSKSIETDVAAKSLYEPMQAAEHIEVAVTQIIDRACEYAGFDIKLLTDAQLTEIYHITKHMYESRITDVDDARDYLYRQASARLWPGLKNIEVADKMRLREVIIAIAKQLIYDTEE